ncbi:MULTISPECIES: hypothetical protein [Methylocaldum]|jgi:hypothetical protein|uniref:hypothetical protein n=1 Tax=unclassified Methylocaldum TaxID=2622260 RepID=UPI001B4816E4|nr:hypothetical protein [Methylocaldum sp. RMAD-M]MBP1148289.1 hypothetical protein [Methylocaldum sp. RMAD-M]
MNMLVRSTVLMGLSVLAGCAEFYPDRYRASYYTPSHDAYSRSDIDELLGFGAAFANKTAASRAEECRRMLKHYRQNPDVGVRLHLLIARTLSEACGDTTKILASVGAIPPERMPDGRVQNLVAIQMETLKRAGSLSRKAVAAERKPDRKQATVCAPDSKTVDKTNPPTDEAKILREKLEAIRAIEKSMDAPTIDTEGGEGGGK